MPEMSNCNPDPLTELAIKHKTDKWGLHSYTPIYHRHFAGLRDEPISLLEIGVGGYDDPEKGGDSLRMWEEYFPKGRIFGIDIEDKSLHDSDRIKTYRGSQIDTEFLDRVLSDIGRVDVVIDDGSHYNSHIIDTFRYIFPRVSNGGLYVVEDLQTSYWEDFGGSSFNLDRGRTAVNYFKSLVDGLNHKELINPRYTPSYFDENIVSISWYHNMVFVQKGSNSEESNRVKNNRYRGQAESQLGQYRRRISGLINGWLPRKW